MPRWSKDEYEQWASKNTDSGKGRGALSKFQERKTLDEARPDNRPKEATVDAEGRSLYRITITLRTSDNRDRDGDGGISTVLDTWLFAIGGLLGVDRGALRKLAKGEERRRGL
jgi:hypothetical protein